MKSLLIQSFRILLLPLLWCLHTVRQASQVVCCCNPTGLSDLVNASSGSRPVVRLTRETQAPIRISPSPADGSCYAIR